MMYWVLQVTRNTGINSKHWETPAYTYIKKKKKKKITEYPNLIKYQSK